LSAQRNYIQNAFRTSERTRPDSIISTDWLLLFREIIGIYWRIILNISAYILLGKMKGFLILKQMVHTISAGISIVNVKKPYVGHAHYSFADGVQSPFIPLPPCNIDVTNLTRTMTLERVPELSSHECI